MKKIVIISILALIMLNIVGTELIYQPEQNEVEDAMIFHGQPDNNAGTSQTCGAWNADYATNYQRGLIKFDLSELPDTVLSVKLLIYGTPRGEMSGQPNIGNISIYQITSDWEENSVTWNNMPNYSTTAIDSVTPDSTQWYEWDITAIYNAWQSGTTNYGLMLINQLEGTARTGIVLQSSDGENYIPMLKIEIIPEPTTIFLMIYGMIILIISKKN